MRAVFIGPLSFWLIRIQSMLSADGLRRLFFSKEADFRTRRSANPGKTPDKAKIPLDGQGKNE
jgi:hypothetical protein